VREHEFHHALLIRLMAGGVFLWEGVMKFVFPHTLAVSLDSVDERATQ